MCMWSRMCRGISGFIDILVTWLCSHCKTITSSEGDLLIGYSVYTQGPESARPVGAQSKRMVPTRVCGDGGGDAGGGYGGAGGGDRVVVTAWIANVFERNRDPHDVDAANHVERAHLDAQIVVVGGPFTERRHLPRLLVRRGVERVLDDGDEVCGLYHAAVVGLRLVVL